jgi:glycosyltransferase involved in cell wall biosynthesis
MDMAEDYPAMLEDTRDYRGFTLVDNLIRNPALLRRIERYVLPRFDAVFAVSDASKRRVVGIGTEESRIHVLENTPRRTETIGYEHSDVSRRVTEMHSPRLLYVGGLEETRGLDFVIEAMPLLIERLGEASLTIAGDGSSRQALEKMVEEAGLQEAVAICGWLDHRYVSALVQAADICLVPHRVTAHTNTTLPNKIYDYMAQGRPTVVSHAESLVGMVEKYACGAWYRDGDVDSFVEAVATISAPERREEAGRNGKAAVEQELNWESSAMGMIRFLRRLTSGAINGQ